MTISSNDAIADGHQYEFSFGTSQMLVDEVDREDIKNRRKVVLPTTAALLIAEYLWSNKWGTVVAFNLPLVTQKFLVDGKLIEESAAKAYLIGQRYTVFEWGLTKFSIMSFQVGALMSIMQGNKLDASPSLSGRIHLAENKGFTMYLGSTVTLGIKGYVLSYGIGHRF